MQQPEDAPPRMPLPVRRAHRRSQRSSCSRANVRVQVQPQEEKEQVSTLKTVLSESDQFYFNWYAHIDVHEEMIKDRVRTDAYKNAIMRHKDFIKGKVVLDVGCGTGILAIFCAQAGASRVYAVEASNIALQAIRVVEANNLSDIIMVLHGRVEDVEINEKVDVIISEWMGYMLLCESMLGSVITARDRWLKPGGLVLPSKATLYMAPFAHVKKYRENIDFWQSVYGIDMSAMIPLAKQCAFVEPSVETITSENVLARPQPVKCVNCYSVTVPELESITRRFKFNTSVRAPLHGFAFWFDVEFTRLSPEQPTSFQLSTSPVDDHQVDSQRQNFRDPTLLLSTAPDALPTHWEQTLIYFYEPIELEPDQLIEGKVTLSQSQGNHRNLNIEVEYAIGGQTYVKVTAI